MSDFDEFEIHCRCGNVAEYRPIKYADDGVFICPSCIEKYKNVETEYNHVIFQHVPNMKEVLGLCWDCIWRSSVGDGAYWMGVSEYYSPCCAAKGELIDITPDAGEETIWYVNTKCSAYIQETQIKASF